MRREERRAFHSDETQVKGGLNTPSAVVTLLKVRTDEQDEEFQRTTCDRQTMDLRILRGLQAFPGR